MKRVRHARWWIVALISCGTIINYLARNSLAVLAPQLQHVLSITIPEYSYVIGAFQLAYALMQPACGLVVDRVGVRLGFALFGAIWSLALMGHALVTGWIGLAFFRGLLGMSEAAMVPAGMKAISEWFPLRDRSTATGWFNAGTSLGSALAPPLIIAISLASSWQMSFVATGAIGLLWAAVWYLVYRSPGANRASVPQPDAPILSGPDRAPPRAAARAILTSRRFRALATARVFIDPTWQTLSFWVPLYLARVRGMDLKHIAMFAWLPFLAADFGGVFGGYLSPLLARRLRMSVVFSRIAGVAVGAVLMIAVSSVGLVASPYTAILLLCIGGFAHQMISVLHTTLSADVFPLAQVGTAVGFIGQVGWISGAAFSLAIGQVVGRIGFTPIFACLSVFDLIAAAVLLASRRQLQATATETAERGFAF